MKIAHINLSDVREGVSGVVRTLMSEQAAQGDRPVLFSMVRRTRDENIFLLPHAQTNPWRQSVGQYETRAGVSGLSASAILELGQEPEFLDADVVHLHVTVADYFSWLLLPALAAKPLVWSIYDAQPFTAGCYHTAICDRWRQQQCQDCPMTSDGRRERAEDLYLLKKTLYRIVPMAVVTPNPWLTAQVKSSMLSDCFAAEIPPAIDPYFSKRADKQIVRQRLSIAQDAFVVAFASPGGLENLLYGGPYVREILDKWKDNNRQVVLLQLGGDEKEAPLPEPFTRCLLPYGLLPEDRSAAYQAADVFLQVSPYDAVAINLLEAGAAGIAPVAFPGAAAGTLIRHLEDGYLASYNTTDEIVKGLRFMRTKPKLVRQLGQRAAERIWHKHRIHDIATGYRDIYDQVLSGEKRLRNRVQQPLIMPAIPKEGQNLEELWEQTGIGQRVDSVLAQGSAEAIWQDLQACWDSFAEERQWERGAFVDLYLSYIIHRSHQPMKPMLLVETIAHWMQWRQLPPRCGNFSATEKLALQSWTQMVRSALVSFLRSTPIEYFVHLSSYQQGCMINLWRTLFFNDFTTPYLEEGPHLADRRQIEATTSIRRIYPDLLIRSMYTPYPPANVKLDMIRILKKDVPIALQVILAFWSVNVPYFDGDEKRQRIMLRNATEFLRSAMSDPETLPPLFYNAVIEHFVPQYWRAAYLGGNMVEELSLFGDFLHQQMKRFHPAFGETIPAKPLTAGRRLRVGYISSNFYNQAVSFYMANRIFFADRQRFEIQVFSLEKRHDNMTDRIKGHCDKFISFSNFGDLRGMAETIKNSELDMLIFADIGMDQVTFQLGAMRLAPVQCVLVGHGVTSGLPTIDYYLSGDFEAPTAQTHYREQLIRLPNLGAAQLPPPFPSRGKWTRKSFNLPEDAVLLVSCANGIKHGRARDALFVRILQQAPNAMIVLKPFMDPSLVQPQWIERVMAAARHGGVEDRLRIVPPLPQGNDLMDFLSLADIQLDTYPYGGWTTNMEAVSAGLAIVTQEGEQARSRWGSHILKALKITAGIAKNEDEYVRQAISLAKDSELRERVRQTIRERAREALFNGAAAQAAYETVLQQIQAKSVEKAQPGRHS